jgi:phosphoheptose isomerase
LGAHVDAWFYCPYHPDGTVGAFARLSADRKPGPGMALAAAAELDLDLTTSWVVGDSQCDAGMARAVGARAFLIGNHWEEEPDVDLVPDLSAAVGLILAEHAAAPSPTDVSEFPAHRYEDAGRYAGDYAAHLSRAMAGIDPQSLRAAARLLVEAHERGATVFSCGNGGSASVANHFQCDHVKGVRLGTGLLTRVQSLSSNMEILSAIANDNGYENVFEFQLESMARPGDVLVAISSSGRSPNIVRALEWCAAHEVPTIALTGFTGGPSREVATVSVHVESSNYGVIEDAHQACMHLLAQYLRQSKMAATDVPTHVF